MHSHQAVLVLALSMLWAGVSHAQIEFAVGATGATTGHNERVQSIIPNPCRDTTRTSIANPAPATPAFAGSYADSDVTGTPAFRGVTKRPDKQWFDHKDPRTT